MVWVFISVCESIVKDCGSFFEADAMHFEVRLGLVRIPFEEHERMVAGGLRGPSQPPERAAQPVLAADRAPPGVLHQPGTVWASH